MVIYESKVYFWFEYGIRINFFGMYLMFFKIWNIVNFLNFGCRCGLKFFLLGAIKNKIESGKFLIIRRIFVLFLVSIKIRLL